MTAPTRVPTLWDPCPFGLPEILNVPTIGPVLCPHPRCMERRPFPVAEKWAALVLEEFALQGDEEKAPELSSVVLKDYMILKWFYGPCTILGL